MTGRLFFIDTEIGNNDLKVHDAGALRDDGGIFHSHNLKAFADFISEAEYLCGHNIIHHDLKYLQTILKKNRRNYYPIDTLYLSPLLFPEHPYHALLKDDKIQTDEMNNPVNDCQKAKILLEDEIVQFTALPEKLKEIYWGLLHDIPEFSGFFKYIGYDPFTRSFGFIKYISFTSSALIHEIREFFIDRICDNAELESLQKNHPVELAYALSLINAGDRLSVFPPWIVRNYPEAYNVIELLRNRPCEKGCSYCHAKLNIHTSLLNFFGYKDFRKYDGENLQEKAVQAAVENKSILAVFPTGGGKSLTFQLPALMAGQNSHGLTIVISPLQSLMKDQVDNLCARGITGCVTINGLLNPVERSESFRQIADGSASILYVSPETLRSRTLEKVLKARNVVRFVIDEAHCFSAWGQDFRIDYQYIADFINKLQKEKADGSPIPVSCFTATAKPKVINDICDYFKKKLNLDLQIFSTDAVRENLHYKVIYRDTNDEKYFMLRSLIEEKNCPTIVYVSRTKTAVLLAEKLMQDGFLARPYHGKMSASDKIANQEDFINDRIDIIVATSAFGMGVDKKDVGLVIHYEISDSLENYVQESGRAGRDPELQAECFVLYNDSDLDKHFILLNQTKLSINEIRQIWKAIKYLSGPRDSICCSALEIARQAGWDNNVHDIESRVRAAVAALENSGYIRRGHNVPHVYASSILVRNMDEAGEKIDASPLFSEKEKIQSKRIIKSLISSRSIAQAGNEDAESRVDYLSDMLGIPKENVIQCISLMRQERILADSMDMSAYIYRQDTQKKTEQILERFGRLEQFIISEIKDHECEFNLKELNEKAEISGISKVNIKDIRTVLYFLTIKKYIQKIDLAGSSFVRIIPLIPKSEMLSKSELRLKICAFIVNNFYSRISESDASSTASEHLVEFSLLELYDAYDDVLKTDLKQQNFEDALLYLSKIGALRLEGGFLVLYNAMEIYRLVKDNRIQYKQEDYSDLNEFYKQKIQQIHIVGEFANMMVRDYDAALGFIHDYFHLDYRKFISRYFKGEKASSINRNMTPQRYRQLFGVLSEKQKAIIDDDESKHIVVVAGPGSGKTRVLVHKLASLLTLEDIKHEQLLMLTFSRAAASEFKTRLKSLIANAANFVEIKTFHSYSFDLMGKIGSLENVKNVVRNAAEMIRNGEVEPERISKSVLVIDEAQDMDENEFSLIRALMEVNENMRVIAVGDDDQNIYEFRGSDSRFMRELILDYDATMYELIENYRSSSNIIDASNLYAHTLSGRLKNKDIVAVKKEQGQVTITHHVSSNMENAIVETLAEKNSEGLSCIMTQTNEEALRILGVLTRKGILARLIQSNDGFSLHEVAEIRYFLKKISKENKISDDTWSAAKKQLCEYYSQSSCLPHFLNMLSVFKSTSTNRYLSDFEEFLRESRYEDFYPEDRGAVYVSTIHKTKGREFDHVYLLLDHPQISSEEDKRKLYVAMTRAKESLDIHINNTLLDFLQSPCIGHIYSDKYYPEPEEISLQLTHRDVVLDFFKNKKSDILRLHSGMPLQISEDGKGLIAPCDGKDQEVVRFSKFCLSKLEQLEKSGYALNKAEIRFILAWKGEEDLTESAVLLPDIYLSR